MLDHVQVWSSLVESSEDESRDPMEEVQDITVMRIHETVMVFNRGGQYHQVVLNDEDEAKRYFDITVDGFRAHPDLALSEVVFRFNYEQMRRRTGNA